MMMNEKPEYPKIFKNCPHCGGTRRFADEVLAANKGDASDKILTMAVTQSQVQMPLYVLSLITGEDVCLDCGTRWAVVITVQKLPYKKNLPDANNLFPFGKG